MRHALKSIRSAIDNDTEPLGGSDETKKALRETVSLIDSLVSKGVIHSNAAARHKSRLAARIQKTSTAA